MNLSIAPRAFYGDKLEKFRKPNVSQKTVKPYVPRNLLNGPNILWKVFPKQENALNFMRNCKDGLMCFAFEHSGSGRLFLVAHPEVFWHYDIQRDCNSRNTYEIITEFTACKIYLDLEYNISLNLNSNGGKMVDIFINVIFVYLQQIWGIFGNKKQVLNLDSTTNTKFSRHLIFNLPCICFSNNYEVGYFVRYVCNSITEIVETNVLPHTMVSQFTLTDIKSLFVVDAKDNYRIFCDEGVYTKNRHFRLYGSTKKGKNANLKLSEDNEFAANNELQLFLQSLITYINLEDIKVLEYKGNIERKKTSKQIMTNTNSSAISPYPVLDKFVSDLVSPGKIYRSVYFSAKKLIVYDIIGNRYCGNIGRAHKSNNVKYVVDLGECNYYQKCYDYDCSGYRSEKLLLPYEIAFSVTDNTDICCNATNELGIFALSSADTKQSLDVLQIVGASGNDSGSVKKLMKFPSFGLSDEEFININC